MENVINIIIQDALILNLKVIVSSKKKKVSRFLWIRVIIHEISI